MKAIIRQLLHDALAEAAADGAIKLVADAPIRVEVSRSKDARFGDYATNAALVLAKAARMQPRQLAGIIQANLPSSGRVIDKTEIAGPGFINFYLAPSMWRDALARIHAEKSLYGRAAASDGPNTLIEFVSANPTGPLHVGHGRGAAVGDTLARLLQAAGYRVSREYYVNDAGRQMRILGESVLLRFRELLGEQIDFPEDHYKGDYIKELARRLQGTPLGERLTALAQEEAIDLTAEYAGGQILQGIKDDLKAFGVVFDNYFSERSLHAAGTVLGTLQKLRSRGMVEDKDGAVWFSMAGQEDEKDRVLVRASGEPTYFAADAAYHEDKLSRGHELLIDVWGADHHGYVPRVRASIEALGYPPGALKVLLVQFVNLVGGVSMSTRRGEFITLKELLDEVGPDAARFLFLTKRCDSHLEFDLDMAKRTSKDNPVYYVQYAHARVASIFRIAHERNIDADMTDPDLAALTLPEEQNIIKHLADFPDMTAEAADALEPHRVAFYLMELAELFHAYYHDNRVLIDDPVVKKARLYFVEAVRQVVANGLEILGVSAPERM